MYTLISKQSEFWNLRHGSDIKDIQIITTLITLTDNIAKVFPPLLFILKLSSVDFLEKYSF